MIKIEKLFKCLSPADEWKCFRDDLQSSGDTADVLETLAAADIDDRTGLKTKKEVLLNTKLTFVLLVMKLTFMFIRY